MSSSDSLSPKFLALLPKSKSPDDLKDSIVGVVGQLELNLKHHKGTNKRIKDFRAEMKQELSKIESTLDKLNTSVAAIASERSTEKAVRMRTWAIITGVFVFGNALAALVMRLLVR